MRKLKEKSVGETCTRSLSKAAVREVRTRRLNFVRRSCNEFMEAVVKKSELEDIYE